jgi:phytoene dehydrogenase-like protein
MTERSILIIGAGVGGLSTGCFAQMNGYRTRILEAHGVPGGLCASWARGGYIFDGCIHNLAGTSVFSPLHELWRELGVSPARVMQPYSEIVRVERPDGPPLVLYSDLDRLRQHMRELFPADAGAIDGLIEAARRFGKLDLLGLAAAEPRERLKALTALPLLIKYGSITLEAYARRFKDPFLRSAFPTLLYDWPQQSMAMLLSFLGGSDRGDLRWPVGGSAAFARAIEKRFKALGGEVLYDHKVQSIIVEDDRAVGVRLADGSQMRADIVVSNAYGPTTIFDMLGGRYVSPAIRRYYDAPIDRVEMGIHVSLGVDRDLSREGHAIVLPLHPPVTIAGEPRRRLYVEPFGFDATLAPRGKGVLKVVLPTSHQYWADLHQTPEAYRAEKERVLEQVLAQLEPRFPGLSRQVEMSDVATPMTTRRYTGNGPGFRWSAAALALALFAKRRLSQTLPGLQGFYMVGQWAGMPGVPMVAAMGRDLVRAICRSEGRPFHSYVAVQPFSLPVSAAPRARASAG